MITPLFYHFVLSASIAVIFHYFLNKHQCYCQLQLEMVDWHTALNKTFSGVICTYAKLNISAAYVNILIHISNDRN